MERPGCKWIVSGLSLLMAAGFLFGGAQCRSLFGGSQNPDEQVSQGTEIADIGDYKIFDGPIKDKVNNGQQRIDPISAKPADYSTAYARELDAQVTHSLLLVEAKDNGFPLDDQAILQAVGTEVDREFDQQKIMAELQTKDLPQNATDQQFSDYFKKKNGKTPAQAKKDIEDGVQKQLDDPARKDALLQDLANDIVVTGFSNKINVTDDDLKHSQDQYVAKRIVFDPAKHPGQDMEKLANKVLADLRAKPPAQQAAAFEAAMNQYSDENASAGKKKSDNTAETDTMTWKTNEDYAPLRNLKQDQISDVVPFKPSGYAIWTLTSIISPPMPDFEKNKVNLRKTYLEQMSAEALQEGLKKLRASNTIKWLVPGWGVLEDWYQATTMNGDFNTKPVADQHKVDQDFFDKGAKNLDSGGLLAAIGAADPIWTNGTPAEKKSISDQYIKTLNIFLDQYPSLAGRFTLVAYYADRKDKANLAKSLLAAARLNEDGAPEGASSEKSFSDIAADLEKYGPMLSKTDAGLIQSSLDAWRDEKLAYDVQKAEQDKQEAEERKRMEAEKAKAALNKPKPPTAPVPGSVGAGVRALPPTGSPLPIAPKAPTAQPRTPVQPPTSSPAPQPSSSPGPGRAAPATPAPKASPGK